MRQFAAYLAAAIAAMANAVRLVWEGGRWVAKAVQATISAPVSASVDAEAAAVAEATLAELGPARDITPADVGPAAQLGFAAIRWLCPVEGQLEGETALLDEAHEAFLGGLTPDQQARLASFPATRIGEHLSGTKPITTLPRAPSWQEHRDAQRQALGEVTETAAQKLRARDEADAVREEAFAWLLSDEPTHRPA